LFLEGGGPPRRRPFSLGNLNTTPCPSAEVQPEWLDIKALQRYACVSERTLREWIHRPVEPLPAAQVGAKILVRRSVFDQWLEKHKVRGVDVSGIVDEIVGDLRMAK
jgi:hypothetical protein